MGSDISQVIAALQDATGTLDLGADLAVPRDPRARLQLHTWLKKNGFLGDDGSVDMVDKDKDRLDRLRVALRQARDIPNSNRRFIMVKEIEMRITKRHLRRIITEEIRDLVDGTPLYITDLGQSMKVTSDDPRAPKSIPRYSVWGYHAGKRKPQVMDGSDDLQALLKKYEKPGESLKVKKINEPRDPSSEDDPSPEELLGRKLYGRMQKLTEKYEPLWDLLKGLGRFPDRGISDDDYSEMITARNEYFNEQGHAGYSGFFFDKRVGMGSAPPSKRRMMPIQLKRYVWEKGYPLEEIMAAWEEYSELEPKFRSFEATNLEDRVYGRGKRHTVVYIHDDGTEYPVSSTTDRKGSLGS